MASPPWSTVTTPLADCILRYLYSITDAALQALKNFLLGILNYIDLQIRKLAAILAQYDLLAKGEEIIWNIVKQTIDALKAALTTVPDGPLNDQCSEFYEYLISPAVALVEGSTDGLSVYRQRYQGLISYTDELNELIAYWGNIKSFLETSIDVIDDAILWKLQQLNSTVKGL